MPTYSYKISVETEGSFNGIFTTLAGSDITLSGSNSRVEGSTGELTFNGNLKGQIDVRAISGTEFTVKIFDLNNDENEIFKRTETTSQGGKVVVIDIAPV